MYIHRTIESVIRRMSEIYPVVLVTGARQVGKTTVLRKMKPAHREISLDSMRMRRDAKTDPDLFLSTYPPPLFIDEIQYTPDLLPSIKGIVDHRQEKGLYWLTGSQHLPIMQGVAESLAGRIGIIHLGGLSLPEICGQPDVEKFWPTKTWIKARASTAKVLRPQEIYQIIWRGQYPVFYEGSSIQAHEFFDSYITAYLERDIQQLSQVGDQIQFYGLLECLANRVGQQINFSNIAKDLQCSAPTIMRWVSILQGTGMIYVLPAFHKNVNKRLTKMPKIYFLDTGLLCYLLNISSEESLAPSPFAGSIIENFVIAEIIKDYWHHNLRPKISFFRDRDQHEIDLLMEVDGKVHPIEIKKKSNPNRADIQSFDILKKYGVDLGAGVVICGTFEPFMVAPEVTAIPLFYI